MDFFRSPEAFTSTELYMLDLLGREALVRAQLEINPSVRGILPISAQRPE